MIDPRGLFAILFAISSSPTYLLSKFLISWVGLPKK
jgi:hypothetical protein